MYDFSVREETKAAELYLAFYKEFGEEHYAEIAKILMGRVAKKLSVDEASQIAVSSGVELGGEG